MIIKNAKDCFCRILTLQKDVNYRFFFELTFVANKHSARAQKNSNITEAQSQNVPS